VKRAVLRPELFGRVASHPEDLFVSHSCVARGCEAGSKWLRAGSL
jgi:hypothetical protein